MFGAKNPPRTNATVIAQLVKKHGKLLKPDEQFVAVCDGFGVAEPHPEPLTTGRRPKAVPLALPRDEWLRVSAAAHLRVSGVHTALGMQNEEFGELPESATGYLLAHTGKRLFLFDGTGKTYLLQAPIKGLWLQPIDHRDGMFTLVFNNQDERVAIATRRQSIELTRAFIESFPDRRGQARILTMATPSQITDF